MHYGHQRSGAGQRSTSQLVRLRDLIDGALAESDWRTIIRRLTREAKQGGAAGTRAAELLLKFRFGPPDQAVTAEPELTPISIIEIHSAEPAIPAGEHEEQLSPP